MYHLVYPGVSTYFYLNAKQQWFHGFSPEFIYRVSFVHNLCLQIFSLITFSTLLGGLLKYGIVGEHQYYLADGNIKNAVFWFYLSKYYEYMDTFIIYAKQRDTITLQKFHHAGAAVVWHLGYIYNFDGIFFASLLNSGVHSIMYLYYLLSLLRTIDVRPMKIYITTLQVGQLVYGAWALPYYYYSVETAANKYVIIIFDTYIAGLIYLFCEFMYRTYFVNTGLNKKLQ